jgi:hypothetical protein
MQGSLLSAPLCVQVIVEGILTDTYGDGSMGVERAAANALTSLVRFAEMSAL